MRKALSWYSIIITLYLCNIWYYFVFIKEIIVFSLGNNDPQNTFIRTIFFSWEEKTTQYTIVASGLQWLDGSHHESWELGLSAVAYMPSKCLELGSLVTTGPPSQRKHSTRKTSGVGMYRRRRKGAYLAPRRWMRPSTASTRDWGSSHYLGLLIRYHHDQKYTMLFSVCLSMFLYLFNWQFNSSPHSTAYLSVNRVSFGSDNGLSPIRRQSII